jgi:hypothetical protein
VSIEGSEDYAAVAARLNNLVHTNTRMTGREIRELVFEVNPNGAIFIP